jgi:hypothetical protein
MITVEDKPGAVLLQLIFDMACFTRETVEAMMYGVEAVATEAAFDPQARTGV